MGILKNLFGKKQWLADYSALCTDFHSHLIPGIDDGAETVEQSIEMLRRFELLGYRKIITTPHILSDHYKNGPHNILPGLELLRQAAHKAGISLQIDAAAEYYCDSSLLKHIEAKQILSFSDRYVLVELSFIHPGEWFSKVVFELQMLGYKVVLAHPERYPYYYSSLQTLRDFRDRGIFLQVNISSLVGHYGEGAKRMATELAHEQMIDFLGSDAHRMQHIDNMKMALFERTLAEIIKSGMLKNALL